MTEPTQDRSELFLRFSRRKLIALLVVVVVVGAVGLVLMLTPVGPVWRSAARASLLPVAIAILVVVQMSRQSRRWAPNSPEVRMAMQDEWLRTNMDRAARVALVAILLAQWPLALIIGFLRFPPPRASMAMAMATITLGLATQIGVFLFLDRD